MKNIEITTEYIKLDSFLKFAGEYASGSDAKAAVQSGRVKVNGQTELRRGRKLYKGDTVVTESGEFNVC